MIRIDAVWLAAQPLDMRCGTDSALARVVQVSGAAKPHHAYVFANRRATRMKVLVYDGIGIWLCARRLHQGCFVWGTDALGTQAELTCEQLQALVLGKRRGTLMGTTLSGWKTLHQPPQANDFVALFWQKRGSRVASVKRHQDTESLLSQRLKRLFYFAGVPLECATRLLRFVRLVRTANPARGSLREAFATLTDA